MHISSEYIEKQYKELANAGKKLSKHGFIRGGSGQLSKRLTEIDDDIFIIKRSGNVLSNVEAYCIVNKDDSVTPIGVKPSFMLKLHRAIYESCSNVNAIVQCRGVYTDAIATVLGEIPIALEMFWAFGSQPVVVNINELHGDDFNQFVDNMTNSITHILAESKNTLSVICIPFFGACITGNCVDDVIEKVFALEYLSKSIYLRHCLAASIGLTQYPDIPDWFKNVLKNTIRPGV